MEELLSLIHWSFFATGIFIAALVGTVQIFKKKIASPVWHDFISSSKSLALLFGIVIGILPGTPGPEIIGEAPSFSHILYFSCSGILGIPILKLAEFIFKKVLPTEIKEWIEKRLGTEGGSDADDPGNKDDSSD